MPKTELEKMLASELYNALDPELVALRSRARELTARYNSTTMSETALRRELLSQLLGSVGKNVWIEPPFTCDYGRFLELGDDVYINFHCTILDCCRITIGNQTMLGPNVQLYAATHPLDAAERCQGLEFARSISIGSQVWIGGGAILCPGVTIGDRTTVGAGSVVTRDIPADVFAAGNPCRVIRTLA